jgi:hypothetical protein
MKMSFILPVVASLALTIPAFAQTSPPPATQEPAMDQSTPAPAAKHMKAKIRAHKKMTKGKRAKAKPAAPADDQAAPQ